MLKAKLPQLKKHMNLLLALHGARAMVVLGDWSPPCLPQAAGSFLPLSSLPGEKQTAGSPETSPAGTWQQQGFFYN